MAEWTWGSDKKAVAMTEQDMKSVIDRVVEAVTKDRQVDMIEQYKQFGLKEAELVQTRIERDQARAEVAALRQHVTQLQGFLAATAPVAGAPFNPYNNAGPAPTGQLSFPTFDQRFAAAAPVPTQFAPENHQIAPATS